MAKKSQVEILVHTPFTFNAPGGEVTEFGTGRIAVDKDVADHWFVKAHANQTGAVTASGTDDELLAQIQALNTRLEQQTRLVTEQAEQIEAKDKALAVLTAEIDALKAGGNGQK
ncbi:hypothetical protein LLP99_17015 [Rouxiella badensis]|uniref:STY1053 family phage-associated protein n=1 Tax=Rouxiella badensis TaxID=1646377 RepID=UPI001D13C656|nr:hypothetical protein [Rouxiella badensis]MCC3717971.1 hypothetical protein [Rouxiella badensis]MCC3730014.1 hypothetical protein [Rouxiella badensis]